MGADPAMRFVDEPFMQIKVFFTCGLANLTVEVGEGEVFAGDGVAPEPAATDGLGFTS